MSLPDLSAVVPAGGRGTRIAGLYPDLPKPMVPARGEPFLHWVAEWLRRRGIDHVVLSVGYRAEIIEAWAAGRPGVDCVREDMPLGTGGAVIACLGACRDWVLVTNGDSLLDAEIGPLFERVKAEGLDGAVIGVEVADAARFGSLEVDGRGLLRGFAEKRPGAGLVNGGVYIFRKSLFDIFPKDTTLSLETDILPTLLEGKSAIAVDICHGAFLDIGTPESATLIDSFINTMFF